MSRRRPARSPRRPAGAEMALDELCVRLGYCLPPQSQEAILRELPADAEAFVDAVLIAEERDPALVSRDERRPMVEIVTRLVYHGGQAT